MLSISQYFYGSNDKENPYKSIFIDILTKRRGNLFTVYALLNIYSISSKKKMDDIVLDKNDITNALEYLKIHENIMYYYYCNNDKLYYLFEYVILPSQMKEFSNVNLTINEKIDNLFSRNFDIDVVKNILFEPKKYLNFNPQKNLINNNHILKQLIISNEKKLFKDIIEKFNIVISDNVYDCGIKYSDLVTQIIETNNCEIMHITNKVYYENQIRKINNIHYEKILFTDNMNYMIYLLYLLCIPLYLFSIYFYFYK